MKILFYIEPWIERDWPTWKNHWLPHLHQISEGLNKVQMNYTFLFIVGDAQAELAQEMFNFPNSTLSIINQSELKKVFPNYKIALDSWYTGNFSESQLKAMQSLIKSKINGFVPNIIWTFMSPVPFLSNMFSDALTLHQEVGALSGAFYPTSWFLDPYGVFNKNLITKFNIFLKSLVTDEKADNFLKDLKLKFQMRLEIEKTISRELLVKENNLSHIVYFPLQYSGHFGTDSNCNFISQFDILCHILDHLDENIGLVTNEHVNPLGKRILNPDTLKYLRDTYPNFIYNEEFSEQKAVSQQLLNISDAVISVSSTLGLQALLWEKPLFTIGDSHLKYLAHGSDISKIGNILRSNSIQSRSGAIYYLLTHYFILHYPYFIDGEWLSKHLDFLYTNREKIKNADEPGIFPRYDSDEKIIEHYSYQTDAIELLNKKQEPPVIEETQTESSFIKSLLSIFTRKVTKTDNK